MVLGGRSEVGRPPISKNTFSMQILLRSSSPAPGAATSLRVDRARGKIAGVSILTGGREATGHGIYIDAKTVAGSIASARRAGGVVKAGIRHPSLIDELKTGGDRILDLPGFFTNHSISGQQHVADFQFFDSFRAQHPEQYAHLMEIADKAPQLFGLSVEMAGHPVFVAQDGAEFPATRLGGGKWSGQPEGAALLYGGLPAFRVSDLYAAAFVDEPAANDGLFAKLSRRFGGIGVQFDLRQLRSPAANDGPFAKLSRWFGGSGVQFDLRQLRSLAEAVLQWSAKQEQEQIAIAAIDAHAARGAFPSVPGPSLPPSPSAELTLAAIKARFQDTARCVRALRLAADEPTLSLDDLAERLECEDRNAEVAELRSARAELQKENDGLRLLLREAEGKAAESEKWRKRFLAIKESGFSSAGLDVGGGFAALNNATFGENPFDPATLNYTRQSEIINGNPSFAELLRRNAAKHPAVAG